MKHLVLGAALAVAPSIADAHPHIFVRATVSVTLDAEGALTAVRLVWEYDDLFSLLLTTDLDIDMDGDLVLTPEESEILTAAVLDWPLDFTGDLTVLRSDGSEAVLGPREGASAAMTDGIVFESHLRSPVVPVAAPFAVQVFDPYYYVAYEIADDITVDGPEGCRATLQKADYEAASSLVQTLLGGRDPGDVGVDEEFPAVGAAFTDTVNVTCSPSP